MAYDPEYYKQNREKLLASQKKYRSNPVHRERYLLKAREQSKKWYSLPENKLRRKQLNQESWQRQLKEKEKLAGRPRPTLCEICSETGTIVFDHCHTEGHFRGWICERCNTVLGKVGDDIIILSKLIDYLKIHSNNKVE